jgi:hypothetical protein
MARGKLNIPDWMIIDAVRYCIGRMTMQVCTTTEWLIDNWEKIPRKAQEIIKRDLEREFECDAQDPENRWRTLGMNCDRELWGNVRKLWKK